MKTWLAALMIPPVIFGQSFEVTSIKPHPGEVTYSAFPLLRGSRVVGTASTLLDMITSAYGVRYDQISGGPGWINTDRFDIEAKTPGEVAPTQEEVKVMVQNLLAERFGLKLHRETKDSQVYFLVIDKRGAKLKESTPENPPIGFTRGTDKGMHMETTKGTMEQLALQLSVTAGRPVIDKTDLAGTYRYSLDWFPANRIPAPDSDVPSIFTAVQEQLGLKLEAGRAPQDFLIIDNAERPSGN